MKTIKTQEDLQAIVAEASQETTTLLEACQKVWDFYKKDSKQPSIKVTTIEVVQRQHAQEVICTFEDGSTGFRNLDICYAYNTHIIYITHPEYTMGSKGKVPFKPEGITLLKYTEYLNKELELEIYIRSFDRVYKDFINRGNSDCYNEARTIEQREPHVLSMILKHIDYIITPDGYMKISPYRRANQIKFQGLDVNKRESILQELQNEVNYEKIERNLWAGNIPNYVELDINLEDLIACMYRLMNNQGMNVTLVNKTPPLNTQWKIYWGDASPGSLDYVVIKDVNVLTNGKDYKELYYTSAEKDVHLL